MTTGLFASAATLAPLLAFLAGGGLVTGFLAGLFGIGGGGILVPVLYEAFGAVGVDPAIRMHMAVGTSLAVIIPTSISGTVLWRQASLSRFSALYSPARQRRSGT